jgi:DNA-directed RNA polymerase specialized sigma24 family protein
MRSRAACERTGYRKRRRVASRETAVAALPELSEHWSVSSLLPFEDLVAPLSERQRAVLTMLKVNGMSIEEVARATASTIGAIKQDAHRAYERLRSLFGRTPSMQPIRPGWRRIEAALSRSSITALAYVANS